MLDSHLEGHLVTLLVRLGVMASLASIMIRSATVQRMLMLENRTISQRVKLAAWFSCTFGLSVATRVFGRENYQAVDLGLEGSLLAGVIGGYVNGLLAGILISLPAVYNGEYMAMPLLAGVGVIGGLLRDCAAEPEWIWQFSPFFDLNIYRFIRATRDHRRTAFHLIFCAAILFSEFLRQTLGYFLGPHKLFFIHAQWHNPHWLAVAAIYGTTLFAVALPLKIWNNSRNEKKLEEQARLLVEARLEALKSQINPHFLFNTLNSVSSLIRTDPSQARVMVLKLSNILRRLLRKHECFAPLREELSFIEDYLAIEMVRFGDKLRFSKEVSPDTLDMLLPSMLIQPLVENCIKHGLSTKIEGGTIRLRTTREGMRLRLLVEDDGVGIPPSKLANLLEQGNGIGVNNVSERLKVLFGNEYRMSIQSAPGTGTRVEIEIPELESHLAAVS